MRTKATVLLVVLGCALGLPQIAPPSAGDSASNRQGFFGGGDVSSFGATTNTGAGAGAGGFQRTNEQNWGPKAYGPGLNNPWALPLNPFVMQRAVSVAERCHGTLVKVEVTGKITITDHAGFEVEVTDMFGNEITEKLTEFEKPEPEFVIGAPPGFRASGFGFPGFSGQPHPGFNSASGGASGGPGAGPLGCFVRRINPFS